MYCYDLNSRLNSEINEHTSLNANTRKHRSVLPHRKGGPGQPPPTLGSFFPYLPVVNVKHTNIFSLRLMLSAGLSLIFNELCAIYIFTVILFNVAIWAARYYIPDSVASPHKMHIFLLFLPRGAVAGSDFPSSGAVNPQN